MKKRLLFMLALLCLVAKGAWATEYISDVILLGSGSSAGSEKQKYVNQGWIDTNYNLNKGCGSSATNIYLLYKTSTNKADAITGFYIQCGSATRQNEQVCGDHTYTPVRGVYDDNFIKYGCNLNNNVSGSNRIYLFYTKEPFDDGRAVTEIWFDNAKTGAVGSNGDESSGCDLNSGGGGSYIYMHVYYGERPNSFVYEERKWDTTNSKVLTTTKTCTNFTRLTSNSNDNHTVLTDGWYVVDYDIEYQEYLDIDGDVKIILVNGKTMNAHNGIRIKNNKKLTIYGQAGDTGKIKADGSIGGKGDIYAGDLVIHGGTIDCKAKSHNNAAIGAGNGSFNSGTGYKGITIYGGIVAAKGAGGGAGIGGGQENDSGKAGPITIYGGTVNATGGPYGAGIGGGEESGNGPIFIYGGDVVAQGGSSGPGIGCGENSHLCNHIHIYGGNITAKGGYEGAGIGNGARAIYDQSAFSYTIFINGGTVIANGGYWGAAIGGGKESSGVMVDINGGKVYATAGHEGAGIGSGSYSNAPTYKNRAVLTVKGGYVEAKTCSPNGAPIGGGSYDRGGTVNIYGGTVKAIYTSNVIGWYNYYIGGGGLLDYTYNNGVDHLDGHLMVSIDGTMARASDRMNACQNPIHSVKNTTLTIEPCTHPRIVSCIDNGDGTHTVTCQDCDGGTEPHNSYEWTAEGYACTKCHADAPTNYCSIGKYTYNASQNAYEAVAYRVAENAEHTLPGCDDIEGYEFAGWVVASSNPTGGNCEPLSGETLLLPGEKIMVTETTRIVARYRPTSINLADDASNESLLRENYGRARTVSLTDRKLWKDGSWNTLCLPFSLTAEELAASQLSGYTGLKELDVEGYYDGDGNRYIYHEKINDEDQMQTGYYDDTATPYGGETTSLRQTGYDSTTGTLYLYFLDATSIEAGKPYIVKWATESPNCFEDPVFSGVTIVNVVPEKISSSDDMVTFTGIYDPVGIGMEGDNTTLFLGDDNKLYHSNIEKTIGSCRAYFQMDVMSLSSLGDVNHDGMVDISDVVRLVNIILGDGTEENGSADVNGDGMVDISDVVRLVNIILRGEKSILNVVVNGADGLTLGDGGTGQAKVRKKKD